MARPGVLTKSLGSLLLVPAYHKFGRRPVMLASLLTVGRRSAYLDLQNRQGSG